MNRRVRSGRRSSVEAALEALRPALIDPSSAASKELLRTALLSAPAYVAARAADAIRDHLVSGLDEELKAAFERFIENPDQDKGCLVKLAVLTALDFVEADDAESFERAVRYSEFEPLRQEDAGAVVRARGVLGLARLHHPEFMLFAGELLADREAPVREAAADALAHRGDPAGAGLIELRLRAGERDPAVLLACLSAMIALAPIWGVNRAAKLVSDPTHPGRAPSRSEDDDRGRRNASEAAALALGQSHRDDALDVLLSALSSEVLAVSRATFLRAIGAHRSERAVEALLRVVSEGSGADAGVAVEALLARSSDPDLLERVRGAAKLNPKLHLRDAVRAVLRKNGRER